MVSPHLPYKSEKQYRQKKHDYSGDGYYFVTICTRNKELFFADVQDNEIVHSEIGRIARKCWSEIPNHFPNVVLDEFVVMPNHVHGIIQICTVGTQNFVFPPSKKIYHPNKFGPQSKNLASIIRGFKIGVTKYARSKNIDFTWQSRYHDRIIRDDVELNRIRQYIIDNPSNWISDSNNI